MALVRLGEIREQLIQYLAGKMSLDELEESLVPLSWNIEKAGTPAAAALVYEVELWLAEYRNGHWTEEELHQKLLTLAVGHVDWNIPEIRTEASLEERITPVVSFHLTPAGR